jgi:hypothetical protein
VQGSCFLEVQVGGGSSVWGGEATLTGSGTDRLYFKVDYANGGGGFLPDGKMTLNNLADYSLTVNSKPSKDMGTLTTKTIEGTLIKPGNGAPPISAAAGKFEFVHGADASAKGTFGANLAPP